MDVIQAGEFGLDAAQHAVQDVKRARARAPILLLPTVEETVGEVPHSQRGVLSRHADQVGEPRMC